MSKPLCVMYIPSDFAIGSGGKIVSWIDCSEIARFNEKEKPDYYWFVLLNSSIKEIEFKVFYEKDFTPIQYAELKKIIEDAIELQKQKPTQ